MSNNIPMIFILIVIGLTGLSVYQMNQNISSLREKIKTVMPTKPISLNTQQNMISCQQWKQKISTCLNDAQTCLKTLNQFSNKHKEYEQQVQECQARNKKNSDRNYELRNQMKEIQEKLNNFAAVKDENL